MKRSPENPSTDRSAADDAPADQRDHVRHSKEKDSSGDTGFLGRWSQRKRNATVPEPQRADASSVVTDDSVNANPLVDQADEVTSATEAEARVEAPLTDADMPDIDTLNADSDFSPFFSEGVSKELRNLALKKLFFSGKFGVRDGLDDYDDDFTHFEPLGDTVTSDMKFHARRKEKARLAELEEQRKLAASEDDDTERPAELSEEVADIEADVADSAHELPDDDEQSLSTDRAPQDESVAVAEHEISADESRGSVT